MSAIKDDPLGGLLDYFDQVVAMTERADRPVYAESCSCGASIEIRNAVPASERRRMHGSFLARHGRCMAPWRVLDAVAAPTDDGEETP